MGAKTHVLRDSSLNGNCTNDHEHIRFQKAFGATVLFVRAIDTYETVRSPMLLGLSSPKVWQHEIDKLRTEAFGHGYQDIKFPVKLHMLTSNVSLDPGIIFWLNDGRTTFLRTFSKITT